MEYEKNLKTEVTEVIPSQEEGTLRGKIEDMKRSAAPSEQELEITRLKAQIATLQDRVGKVSTPYASGKTHDHSEFYGGDHIKIALISFIHLGTRLEWLHVLKSAYKKM